MKETLYCDATKIWVYTSNNLSVMSGFHAYAFFSFIFHDKKTVLISMHFSCGSYIFVLRLLPQRNTRWL